MVARAIAARTKARELGVLAAEVDAMIAPRGRGAPRRRARHRARSGAAARQAREADRARAELLPKQAAAPEAGVDLAAQLKNAMRQNAFGDLRFSGRDPVEVVDELRASWAEVGPILDDEDRAQLARFEDTVEQVLDAAGGKPRQSDDRSPRDADAGDRGGRRRRRDREPHRGEQPAVSPGSELAASDRMRASDEIAVMRPPIDPDAGLDAGLEGGLDAGLDAGSDSGPDAGAEVGPEPEPGRDVGPDVGPDVGADIGHDRGPDAAVASGSSGHPVAGEAAVPASIPLSAHDAITVPVRFPPPDAPAPPELPVPAAEAAQPDDRSASAQAASTSPLVGASPPPAEELEAGWDLGDEDPTAGSDKPEAPEVTTPSSSEMAGDGAVEGDGLDTGWD